MIIKLVRHGQSTSNANIHNPAKVGDKNIVLTDLGWSQAKLAGQKIGEEFLNDSLVYCSPFTRTRQTLEGMMKDFNSPKDLDIREDNRLREISYGYCSGEDYVRQHLLRPIHGWFYYKFEHGESPAMVYDRSSDFIGSVMRRRQRMENEVKICSAKRNLVIVGHGTTNRCLLMRYMHLTVEQFEEIDTPPNCGIYTIAPIEKFGFDNEAIFVSPDGRWGCSGDFKFYGERRKGIINGY